MSEEQDVPTQEIACKSVRAWLYEVAQRPRISLLEVQDDQVTPRLSTLAKLGMKRSPELSEKLKSIRDSVQKEFKKSRKLATEGICYLVYREADHGEVEPLYVGIAQTIGKSGILSVLFAGGWLRFAEGIRSNGHIGNLNANFAGRPDIYANWRKALFCNGPKPKLKKPVFVDVQEWSTDSQSIWPKLGHVPLFLEEGIRIWFLQLAGYGARLLNRDGNRSL
jgi:hypothetical protein